MRAGLQQKSKRRPWGMILGGGTGLILVAALVAYFAIKGFPVLEKPGGKELPKAAPIHESKEFNYRFVFPESAWKQDSQTRLNVKANLLAMKRSNPNAWFTLAARGFKNRTPEKKEVIDEAVKRLEGYFQELEWDPGQDGFLAQRSAPVLLFQGKVEKKLMKGECYFLIQKGMVYWFTTWCAAQDADALDSEWPKIRDGFTLLENKEN
jgi:hypothetical protein